MNVIVIGGGASGLMAALTAARNGHAVTLLERQSRVGRKLLSTGNGRCNLDNEGITPEISTLPRYITTGFPRTSSAPRWTPLIRGPRWRSFTGWGF